MAAIIDDARGQHANDGDGDGGCVDGDGVLVGASMFVFDDGDWAGVIVLGSGWLLDANDADEAIEVPMLDDGDEMLLLIVTIVDECNAPRNIGKRLRNALKQLTPHPSTQ